MNQPSSTLPQKTCAICGIEKPLSAYRHVGEESGLTYSAICHTCRSKGALKEVSDDTRSRTGHQIDTKSKVHSDKAKKSQQQKVDEEYHKERDEIEKTAVEDTEKKELKTADVKKQNLFLDKRRPLGETTQKKVWQHQVNISQRTEKEFNQEAALNSDTENQKESGRAEEKKTKLDFTVAPVNPGAAASQIRYQSAIFQQFKQRIGRGTPTEKNPQNKNNETIAERIEKTWGPKSGK